MLRIKPLTFCIALVLLKIELLSLFSLAQRVREREKERDSEIENEGDTERQRYREIKRDTER